MTDPPFGGQLGPWVAGPEPITAESGLGAYADASSCGLTPSASDVSNYILNEVAATTGIPALSLQGIANAIASGDGGQIALATDAAIAVTLGGAVGGAVVGIVATLLSWLSSPPNLPGPCRMPGCAPSGLPTCNTLGDTSVTPEGPPVAAYLSGATPIGFHYTDLYPMTGSGFDWDPGLPNTWRYTIIETLLSDWDQQMQPTPDTSSDIGVCGRQVQGIDPINWAYQHLGGAFVLALNGWNATHQGPSTPVTVDVRSTRAVFGETSYDVPAGADPISMALNVLAINAGMPANSSITFNVNIGPSGPPIPPPPQGGWSVVSSVPTGFQDAITFFLTAPTHWMPDAQAPQTPPTPNAAGPLFDGSAWWYAFDPSGQWYEQSGSGPTPTCPPNEVWDPSANNCVPVVGGSISASPPATTSPVATVAIVTAGAAAVVASGIGLYAYEHGMSYADSARKLWKKVRGR